MDGKLRNCPYCNRIYLDLGDGCCPECKDKQEAQRDLVREYMAQHAEADIVSIARGTGLSLRVLMRMRREGFLTVGGPGHSHCCKRCGAPLEEGIYCRYCVAAFARKRTELANRRIVESMRGIQDGRREADTKFLTGTYAKFSDPLVKVAGKRYRRNYEGILQEYEEQYGERRR